MITKEKASEMVNNELKKPEYNGIMVIERDPIEVENGLVFLLISDLTKERKYRGEPNAIYVNTKTGDIISGYDYEMNFLNLILGDDPDPSYVPDYCKVDD